ncbi:hypothetical protein DL96DRAFT_1629820 [Flagelloscypha sp. PMI_526]|nr:hypothetical protein DL96DRAFT_1629820 [Flagelloscypha sp. PMI_526]
MGVAVGGKISQKIYEDAHSPVLYDEDDRSRIFIHTVSTAAWEVNLTIIFSVASDSYLIALDDYLGFFDYPWFALYDEHLPTVKPTDKFNNIQSIAQTDYIKSTELVDPESPPDCASHTGRTSTCIARPCGHPACGECFGASLFTGWKCPFCTIKVVKYAGFDKPVPKVDTDGGNWWEAESQIQGVVAGNTNGQVTTLFIDEDKISGLHGSSAGPAK